MHDQPDHLFEAAQPLDEAKLAKNRPLVEALLEAAAEPAPVMTAEQFREWLKQS